MDEERVPRDGAEQDGMMVYIDPNVIHSMAAAAARKQAGLPGAPERGGERRPWRRSTAWA